MAAPIDRFLEAHPDVAAAWYPPLTRAVGRALTLPGLARWSGAAGRVEAVARPAGRTTTIRQPVRRRPATAGQLTVMSANLWHDWPRQHRWSERLEAVAQLVEAEEVDVLLLQEVARTPALKADVWLATRLGMSLAYARANGDVDAVGFEEGSAVLSRYPVVETQLSQLGRSRNPLVRRVAIGAHLATPPGRLLAVSAHLGLWRRANAEQIRELRGWVAEVSGGAVAVVGGDFNAPEGRPEIERTRRTWTDTFRHAHPEADAGTHVSTAPWRRWSRPRRLDYVFVQQPPTAHWRVVAAAHVDAHGGPHSDHRAVVARLLPG